MRLLLFAGLALISTRLLLAETPAPSPPAQPTRLPVMERIVNDDLALLELEMAENGYTINKSLESATRLLSIIEKVISIRCLAEVHSSLGRSLPSEDEICVNYAKRALRIDPGNVVALCVLNGIDSLICKGASEAQVLRTYDPKAEVKNQTASLDEVVATKRDDDRIRTQTIELENKISARSLTGDNVKLSLQEKKVLMSKILEINCARPRIKLLELNQKAVSGVATRTSSMIVQENETEVPPAQNNKAKGTPDAFSVMLQEHFTKPTPLVEIPKSARVYENKLKCKEYIEEAFKLDPNMAMAACHKWGFYSWQCINAKRHEGLKGGGKKEDSFTRPTGQIQKF